MGCQGEIVVRGRANRWKKENPPPGLALLGRMGHKMLWHLENTRFFRKIQLTESEWIRYNN